VRKISGFAMMSLATLTLVTGCKDKIGGQVAAKVNGDEITQIELQQALQGVPPAALTNAQDKRKVLDAVLQKLVDRQIMVQQAKADGVDKTPDYAVELKKMQDELIIRMNAAKIAKDIAPADEGAVAKFISDNPMMFAGRQIFSLDQIMFSPPKDKAVLAAFPAAHTLDAVAGLLSARNVPFSRAKGQMDTATLPPGMAKQIASLPAGEPMILPQGGQIVAAVVTATTAAPVSDEQAKAIAKNMLRQKAVNDAMDARLKQGRLVAKVEYGTGFEAPAKK